MNPNEEYKDLVSKIISCKNKLELKDVISEINKFIVRYNLPEQSKSFQKLKNLVGMVKKRIKGDSIDESENFFL